MRSDILGFFNTCGRSTLLDSLPLTCSQVKCYAELVFYLKDVEGNNVPRCEKLGDRNT